MNDAPKSLGSDQYRSLTGKSKPAAGSNTGVKAGNQPHLEYLKLTPRDLWSGFGWLEFAKAAQVDPKDQSASFYDLSDSEPGWTRAFLKVQKGERYLLDFSINAGIKSKFDLSTPGGSQEVSVDKGKHHVLMYLDADKTEVSEVTIKTDQAVYTFYALEITRID